MPNIDAIFLNTSDTVQYNTLYLFKSSVPGTYSFPINLGQGTGIISMEYYANPYCANGESNCGINFGNPDLAIPDKFSILWKDNTYTSGYRGGDAFTTILNNALIASGLSPEGLSGNGNGTLSFIKDTPEPVTGILQVDSPVSSSRWAINVSSVNLIEPSPTPTPTVSVSATSDPTATPTPTVSVSATSDPTVTPTPTVSVSVTSSPTATPTPTVSVSVTSSPTATPTPTVSVSATSDPTATPTPTVSVSVTSSPTATPTPTVSVSATSDPTATPTPTVSVSATSNPTAMPTPTPTNNISFINDISHPVPSPPANNPTPTISASAIIKYVPTKLQCEQNGIFNVLTPEFHNTFTKAIDTLLDSSGLSVPCKLKYASPLKTNQLCNNCIFNYINNTSSGIFSGTGPKPFPEGSICPICMGKGVVISDGIEETINMLVIFDSKYFINLPTDSINIPNSMAQTICCISYYPKIKNTYEAILNSDLMDLTSQTYERTSEPQPMGLGKTKYILTTWKRK